MSWVFQRQLIYFFIAAFIFIIFATGVFLVFKPEATCFDGKKNQDEESVDCGGVCSACLGETKDIIVLWSNVFPLGNGKYEVASLLKNPNFFAGLPELKYRFKLYDVNNILISVREGKSFMNPNEEYLIFETDISVGERVPKRVFIEFDDLNWQRIEKKRPQIFVTEKNFNNSIFPILEVKVTNKSLSSFGAIEAAAILFDEEDNAIGVSITKIGALPPEFSKTISFTWPKEFSEIPSSSEILIRDNLTNASDI